MDDIGLHLSRQSFPSTRAVGRGLVKGMPIVMQWLSAIGTAAMIWVGGGIFVHGLEVFGLDWPGSAIHHAADAAGDVAPIAGGPIAWTVTAIGSGLFGLVLGSVLVANVRIIARLRGKPR
jgi:predicted DNA repair protein MutK